MLMQQRGRIIKQFFGTCFERREGGNWDKVMEILVVIEKGRWWGDEWWYVLILGKGVNLTRFLFFGPKNGSKNTQKSTNEMQCDIKCYWIILKEQNSAGERIAVFHVISKLFFQDDWTSTILLLLACNICFFIVELFGVVWEDWYCGKIET